LPDDCTFVEKRYYILTAGSNELVIDTVGKRLFLPLAPGTNPKLFKPAFVQLPGISVVPQKKVDFSKGAVPYRVTIIGHRPVLYLLSTRESSTIKSSEHSEL